MNVCPACYQHLALVDYEGFKILQCTACKGHLLELNRLESIKRTARMPEPALKSAASSDFKGSIARVLRCPRCHVDMRKQPLHLPVIDASADFCRSCSLVWLDGGELALIQIAYEASSKFRNVADLQRRARALEADPERKAAFVANLAKLPQTQGTSVNNLGDPDLEPGLTVIDTISRILLHDPHTTP